MRVLVVGNGFDLAHGLPTTYTDCLNFLRALQSVTGILNDNKEFYFEAINKNSKLLKLEIKEYLKKQCGQILDDSRLVELKELVKNNVWLEYFLIQKKIGKGWIDFETEIKMALMKLNKPSDSSVLKYKILNDSGLKVEVPIHITGDECYRMIIEALYKELKNFTRCLELYLCICMDVYACKIDTIKEDFLHDEKRIDKVLSFNYTDTYSRLYNKGPISRLYNKEPTDFCYIHGKADQERRVQGNTMVLGIDDYLSEEEQRKDLDLVAFKKYYQRIFNQTDYNYVKWFERDEDRELIIYGHSLDVTDGDVLRKLLLAPRTKNTHILSRSNC